MKNFNWGTGIFLAYTLFAVSMITMALKTRNYDHSLVVENYYEEDLKYQQRLDKIANSRALVQPLVFEVDQKAQQVFFDFPDHIGEVAGEVWFYRPSDKAQDLKIDLELDGEGKMRIPLDKLQPGRWKISVDWTANEKSYWDQRIVTLAPKL